MWILIDKGIDYNKVFTHITKLEAMHFIIKFIASYN